MKKEFLVFVKVLFASFYVIGCSSQLQFPLHGNAFQPTSTPTAIPFVKPTATADIIKTPWGIGTIFPTVTLDPNIEPLITLAPLIFPTSTPVAKSIFDPFPMKFHRNTVKINFGIIPASGVIKENIIVDNTLGDVHFTLAWREGDLDIYLIQPNGNIIDASFMELYESQSFTSDSMYKEYLIDFPQQGVWTIVISNKTLADTNYRIEAYSTACPMNVDVYFNNEVYYSFIESKNEYRSGDCIKISSRIEDIISLTSDKIYVLDAVVRVTAQDPKNNQYSFNLYDDGFHGDVKASDGIYGNVFCNTINPGKYFFHVQISGTTNFHYGYNIGKLPFTREYIRSLLVH